MSYLHRSRSPGAWNPTLVPSCPVALDTTHPLARGLVGLYLPGINYTNFAGNLMPALTVYSGSAPPAVSGPLGPGATFNGTNQVLTAAVPISAAPLSLMLVATASSTGVPAGILSASGSWYWDGWYFGCGSLNSIEFECPSNNTWGTGNDGLTFPTTGALVAVAANSSSRILYTNNAISPLDTSTQTPSLGNYYFSLGAARHGTTTDNFYAGIISAAGIYNTSLGAGLATWLASEPFAMLRPIVRRQFYFVPSGSGTITGTVSATATTTGTLSANGALTGASSTFATTTGTLTGLAPVIGTTSAIATVTAVLAGVGSLTGSSVATAVVAGTIGGQAPVTGTAIVAATTIGALTGVGTLTGTTAAIASTTASLTGSGVLAGTAVATVTVVATLAGIGGNALAGSAIVSATASATLTGKGAFTAAVICSAAATGTLMGFGPISGMATVIGSSAAMLTGAGSLDGLSTSSATTIGTMIGFGSLLGVGTGSAIANGTLHNANSFNVTAVAVAEATGLLTGCGTMSCLTTATSNAIGYLTNAGALTWRHLIAASPDMRLISPLSDKRFVSAPYDS